MSALLQAVRGLQFALWARWQGLRLRRLGGAFVVHAPHGAPRCLGLPRVEVDGFHGRLELRFGRDVKLGRDVVFDVAADRAGTIALGDRCTVQNRVRFQAWGGTISLGAGAQVRDADELKSSGVLTIGERTIFGRNVTVHCEERIEIGAKVGFAERVTVIDSDHGFDGSDTFFMEQPVRSSPVAIGDNVFLATNVVVLRGTSVGANSVAAAGAVLNGGVFPASHVIAGVPARALKPLG